SDNWSKKTANCGRPMKFCVRHLLQNGPVLKEGSTFGVSESDRIEVHLQNSTRFDNLPVIAATLGASQLATTK
ncbi:MAG: hypothetical protein ABF719_12995, partial [Acetobacter sp.]|uniref:hypothetical protein n=1 Tax=Acetobacter sp. TaxID=440 RepID=UPI0039E8F5F6